MTGRSRAIAPASSPRQTRNCSALILRRDASRTSTNGRYGSDLPTDSHRAATNWKPLASASMPTSATSRVFPTPASPVTTTSPPWPPLARPIPSRNDACSASRPTKGVRPSRCRAGSANSPSVASNRRHCSRRPFSQNNPRSTNVYAGASTCSRTASERRTCPLRAFAAMRAAAFTARPNTSPCSSMTEPKFSPNRTRGVGRVSAGELLKARPHFERSRNAASASREHDQEPVTRRLHDSAVLSFGGITNDAVVITQKRYRHLVAVGARKRGRALHVCEEDRHRRRAHTAQLPRSISSCTLAHLQSTGRGVRCQQPQLLSNLGRC